MDVTVSILTYNNEATLRECLASVLSQQGVSVEPLVIDNASRDRTLQVARSEFPKVPVVAGMTNEYFARGHNRILREPWTGEFLLILNPDVTLVERDTLRRLIAPMRGDASIAAVTCPHEGPGGKSETVGKREATIRSMLASFSLIGRAWPAFQADAREKMGYPPPDGAWQPVDVAQASCLLVRASVFRELGGFDPRFSLYFTDDELCRRIRAKGYQVALLREPRVVHRLSHSLHQLGIDRRMRLVHRDARLYSRLYMSPGAALAVHAATIASWFLWRALSEILVGRPVLRRRV